MEEGMMRELGVPFYGVAAGKMRRYFSLQNLWDWCKVPVGIVQAWRHVRHVQAKVVFSKGGYAALPVVIGAWMARVPVIIHESDVRPGLTTRLCSHFADKICISWEETKRYLPVRKLMLTGVPIRSSLLQGDATTGRKELGIPNTLPLLMVAGGSLGAGDINDFIAGQLPWLLQNWNIYHLTGAGKAVSTTASGAGLYIQREFDPHFENALAAAEVVLSRAGTTALAEFAALGKKVILIPLPLDRSRGDQIDNARAYAAQFPTTRVIDQEHLTETRLRIALEELHAAPKPTPHKTKATEQIASLLLGYEG